MLSRSNVSTRESGSTAKVSFLLQKRICNQRAGSHSILSGGPSNPASEAHIVRHNSIHPLGKYPDLDPSCILA